MTTITVFDKGTEDIAYDPFEGDIIVNYYLICETDENENVVRVVTFAYGSQDHYFALYEEELLKEVKSLKDAKAFKVAKDEPANREYECRLSWLMKVSDEDPFFVAWMERHRKEYDWEYDQ